MFWLFTFNVYLSQTLNLSAAQQLCTYLFAFQGPTINPKTSHKKTNSLTFIVDKLPPHVIQPKACLMNDTVAIV